MPPQPPKMPLRAFQGPGFSLKSMNIMSDATRCVRPPP